MNTNFDSVGRQAHGAFTRVVSVIVGVVVLTTALMFSLFIFAGLAIAGLILWSYFWWRTRELRQQMREQVGEQTRGQQKAGQFTEPPSAAAGADGDVIEGEAVRVVDARDRPDERGDPPAM